MTKPLSFVLMDFDGNPVGGDSIPTFPVARLRLSDWEHVNNRCGFVRITGGYDAAVDLVARARKVTLYVSAVQFAPSIAHEGQGFRIQASVPTTRAGALRFLANAYSKSMRERALVQLDLHGTCLFIGSTAI